MARLLSLVVCLVAFPVLAFAARPLSTDDAGTVEKGSVEIEYGVEYVKGSDHETAMSLVLTTGVLSCLDFGVEVPYVFIDAKEASDSDGFSDVSIFTKCSFVKDKDVFPDTALKFSYKTHSGNNDRNLGTGKPEYSLNGIFSKAWDQLTAHLNIGYAFREDFKEEDNEDALTYSVAFEYALSDKTNLVAEVVGETALKRKFDDNSCSALVGVNHSLNDNLTLDFGVGTGISRSDPDFKVTSGITFTF